MIKFYKTLENRMTELPEYSEGCWVSAVCPTPDEIRYLIEQLGVMPSISARRWMKRRAPVSKAKTVRPW